MLHPNMLDSIVWKVQDQNITANGTCLRIVQTGENEMAEAIDHPRAPTKFPAAYTGGSKQTGFSLQAQGCESRKPHGHLRLGHPFHTPLAATDEPYQKISPVRKRLLSPQP